MKKLLVIVMCALSVSCNKPNSICTCNNRATNALVHSFEYKEKSNAYPGKDCSKYQSDHNNSAKWGIDSTYIDCQFSWK